MTALTDGLHAQIVASITAGWQEYHLDPFFYDRPKDLESVIYRQQVMQELEAGPVMQAVQAYSQRMRAMRQRHELANKRHSKQQEERTFLGAVEMYCEAVRSLCGEFRQLELHSRGMLAFRDYLVRYMESASFAVLAAEIARLTSDLAGIRYSLPLGGDIQIQFLSFERARRGSRSGSPPLGGN